MSGRVTLVTGASSGIGRELAKLAAADSGAVVLVARRRERLEELAEELGGSAAGAAGEPPTRAVVLPADLTSEQERRDLAEELARRDLPVDHLINCAGFGVTGRLDRNDPATERDMVALNAVALHDLLLRFLPGMVERGYGRVLNVASTAGYQPLPWMAAYAATKAFVLSLSEALWREYRGTGVSVTCLAPGKTETEFIEVAEVDSVAFGEMPGSSPADVAEAGYRGMMRGKRTVIPGLHNRVGSVVARFSPRGPLLAVGERLFKPDED